jgi:hypothetical protein
MIKGKAALLARIYEKTKFFKSVDVGERMDGATPPSVFIGSYGYPKVYVGPMTPPLHGDTSILDYPEQWLKKAKTPEEIVNLRLQLVRGKKTVDIKDENRFIEGLRDIALAKRSTEVELEFSRKPTGGFFHEELQPFGPSAPIKNWRVNENKYDEKIEKAYYDTDLKASDAIIELYRAGVDISAIQRALSVGAFGLKKNRKLVPTRWAITAVDSTISERMLEEIKSYPQLDEYRVYEYEHMRNKFIIILIPQQWSYESMEAFFKDEINYDMFSDFEMYHKKKEYALIGGCYYSCRMAAAEILEREKKQAAVIILREAYKDYIPLGVWLTRECVREALKREPKRFNSMSEMLGYTNTRLKIQIDKWIKNSILFKNIVRKGIQTTLRQFLTK